MPTSRLAVRFNFEANRLAVAEGRSEASGVRCPICLVSFDWNDLAAGRMTIEHPIPRKVGGRMVTITCRSCNNEQGSKLDKHVVEAAKSRDALASYGNVRSSVTIEGAKLEANLAWKPDPADTNVITVIPKASNPNQVRAAMDHLRSGAREVKLSISLGHNPNKLSLGVLRAAYLGLFNHYGYAYVQAPSVEVIRRQITGKDAPSPYLGKIVAEISTLPVTLRYGFLGLDLQPSVGNPVYLVLVQLKKKLTTTYGVLLPHAGSWEDGLLGKLAAVSDELKGRTLTVPLWRTGERSGNPAAHA